MPAKASPRAQTKKTPPAAPVAPAATPDEVARMQASILHYLKYKLGRDPETANGHDWWIATATAVRDRVIERGLDTYNLHRKNNVRRVYYLSMEYLMGRLMLNNLINLGLHEATVEALKNLGQDF